MKKSIWIPSILTLLLAAFLVGCQSDVQRIRATNEALHTPGPTATSTPLIAEIPSIDIEEGDCINSTLPEGVTFESVEIVSCAETWEYRTLNLIQVRRSGSYPGEDFFDEQVYEHCDPRTTNYIYPASESWAQGGRRIACLQQSFGLSVSDPAKLDRLVGYENLRAGECYNEAPETDFHLVELVNCSGEWEYRVTSLFEIADLDSFPGEDSIEQEAYDRCEEPYDSYLFPSLETWELGDRVVLCIEEGF